jgi:hypothetical protein
MPLYSPAKKFDQELLVEVAALVEIAHRLNQKRGDDSLKKHVESMIQWYQELKYKIDNYDYTAKDKAYWRLEKLLTGGQPEG